MHAYAIVHLSQTVGADAILKLIEELGAKGRHTLQSLQKLKERRQQKAATETEEGVEGKKRQRTVSLNEHRARLVTKKKVTSACMCMCSLVVHRGRSRKGS